ncbi:MAG: nicotinamide riboside transporter PnuC [Pseudomonadota bacterium]|nr:nicotinamide riboside transporter PnuC [Pseudomonadota bacterium]MDO7711790.1 nicotinamide riboside transporter PnuC [Pseudomonadota bacterium]
MSDWLTFIIDAFAFMSGWEIFAALLGMAYIIFAARESQWCWPIAFISTLIYTVLFWEGQLPMQALLNFYYMGMAIYGYMLWRKHGVAEDKLAITSWSWIKQLTFLLIATVLSMITAYYLEVTETSQNPYLDASVTIFSVMNTWLMAKKVLQNWLYWVVIDGAAIVLYAQSGYFATVILFSVYTILAIIGFISWQKLYRQQSN